MTTTSPESARGRNLTEAMAHLAAANTAINAIDARYGSMEVRNKIRELRTQVGGAADLCNNAIQEHLRDSAEEARG